MEKKYLGDEKVLDQVLKSETNIHNYSQQAECDLKNHENLVVNKYIKSADQIVTLHKKLKHCGSVLTETQNRLGYEELQNRYTKCNYWWLQQRSIYVAQQLCNRQYFERLMQAFIEDGIVSEIHISVITTCSVTDEHFATYLSELYYKTLLVIQQDFKDIKSLNDAEDVYEKLKITAISKIRHFIIE